MIAIRNHFIEKNDNNINLIQENKNLKIELEQIKNEIEVLKTRRNSEMEIYKKSFDEMDSLVEKEREVHKTEEESLRNANQQLQTQINCLNLALETMQKEKAERDKHFLEMKSSQMKTNTNEIEKKWKNQQEILEKKVIDLQAKIDLLKSKCANLETTNERLQEELLKSNQYKSLFEIERKKVRFK